MAFTQTMNGSPSLYGSASQSARRQGAKQRFVLDLSQCLFDFVIQLLPTAEEMAVKEDVRKLLERLIRTIEPHSRLLSFGSTANGFSLRNSDMDLCCLIDSDNRRPAAELVTMLGELLERETKFHVKPLPHARIPIVKLSLDPSPGLPLGIACDIGFENRLALENTRLLMCYAMIDPTRVRTMVLFLKVWSKRRKINSPYKGTLSSYGYVLLVLYFLVHVKNPPVLPNLQQMPPLRPITKEDTHLAGYNTWFFDDIELLRQRWHSENVESVAELLIDFFRYFSRDFLYNTGVASIRAGLLKKDTKGWQNDLSGGRFNDARERNRLAIEDPFEGDYNVARCVTRDGLYTIRGEFMRAARVLANRPERAIVALAELCEERKEEEVPSTPLFVNPKLSSLPPQTPYTVGSQSLRPKGAAPPERLSPPSTFFESGSRPTASQHVSAHEPPEHMSGSKRSKWTSPPPPEASSAAHTLFEEQLGIGIELATASTEARERETSYTDSSSNNSEVLTDEERSDFAESDYDTQSMRSFTEGSSPIAPSRKPVWIKTQEGKSSPSLSSENLARLSPLNRGRISVRDPNVPEPFSLAVPPRFAEAGTSASFSRRSISGPPRTLKGFGWSSSTPLALVTPLPRSPESPQFPEASTSNVFYQTAAPRSPQHPTVLYPIPTTGKSSLLSQYPNKYSPSASPNTLINPDHPNGFASNRHVPSPLGTESDTPRPSIYPHSQHSHSLSSTTITAPTPPSHISKFATTSVIPSSPLTANASRSRSSRSRSRDSQLQQEPSEEASTSASDSPTPSSSTGYNTSLSRSPSRSPPPLPPASPILAESEYSSARSSTVSLATPKADAYSSPEINPMSLAVLTQDPLYTANAERPIDVNDQPR